MWWLEWRHHARSLPAPAENPGPYRTWRIYGLVGASAVWAATLNILPLAKGSVISGFWQTASVLWPALLVGLYFYLLRPATGTPSGTEQLGYWLKERPRDEPFPWHILRDQLVKAFFLPLMVSFAYDWASQADPWAQLSVPHWYFFSIAVLYLIDTAFATVGYLSTSKRLDAHIRSSNPYWLGWASALICYPPFFTWLQQAGFNYRDGQIWADWLPLSHPLFHVWGVSILLLSAIYALSTVVFGIRFSNLTHRGIITHGPYRWTKHPAYISKNLSWWMISVPFISTSGTGTALLHCAILLIINGIYWLRAKTEERHLMYDPDYQAYAEWVGRHGLFAKLLRPSSGT